MAKQQQATADAELASIERHGESVLRNKRFHVKRQLVYPLFRLEPGVPGYFRFDTPAYIGKEIPSSDMNAPVLAQVTDLETGELGELMLGHVLLGVLDEKYPGQSYVGKGFEITRDPPTGARRYNLYMVNEVELDVQH